jgi:hypothetical protein
MDRRTFVCALTGGLLATPLAVEARFFSQERDSGGSAGQPGSVTRSKDRRPELGE